MKKITGKKSDRKQKIKYTKPMLSSMVDSTGGAQQNITNDSENPASTPPCFGGGFPTGGVCFPNGSIPHK